MRIKFTDAQAARIERDPEVRKKLVGPSRCAVAFETQEANLQMRISPRGVKTRVATYYVPMRSGEGGPTKYAKRFLTLGRYPSMGVGEARSEASDVRKATLKGKDPATERARAKAEARRGLTLAEWWGEWAAEKSARGDWRISTAANTAIWWRAVIAPGLGGMRLDQIGVDDVRAWHRAEGARAPVQANRALAILHRCLAEATERGLRPAPNPAAAMATAGTAKAASPCATPTLRQRSSCPRTGNRAVDVRI